MLTVEQLDALYSNRQYEKTKGLRYNWNYAGSVVGNPHFSASDIKIDGKPWEQGQLILKIIIWMFKRVFISQEIGEFKHAVINRILNSSLGNDFDICVLIGRNMKWIEAKSTKMEYVKQFTIDFISKTNIQLIIFDTIKITDKDERRIFMEEFVYKINCVFSNLIAKLMKDNSLISKSDYILFLEKHQKYLTEHFQKQLFSGNLFSVNQIGYQMEET
jgi:hypothetical protein